MKIPFLICKAFLSVIVLKIPIFTISGSTPFLSDKEKIKHHVATWWPLQLAIALRCLSTDHYFQNTPGSIQVACCVWRNVYTDFPDKCIENLRWRTMRNQKYRASLGKMIALERSEVEGVVHGIMVSIQGRGAWKYGNCMLQGDQIFLSWVYTKIALRGTKKKKSRKVKNSHYLLRGSQMNNYEAFRMTDNSIH